MSASTEMVHCSHCSREWLPGEQPASCDRPYCGLNDGEPLDVLDEPPEQKGLRYEDKFPDALPCAEHGNFRGVCPMCGHLVGSEIRGGSEVARAELVELVETVREALGELYGQGDVRFNGVTPKREGNEALDELCRRCDSLMVRAGLAETYIPAARYDAYKTRLRLLLSSEDATRPTDEP